MCSTSQLLALGNKNLHMLYEYNETQNLFLKLVNGKSELKEVNDLLAYFFQCIGESHRNFPHMQNFFLSFSIRGEHPAFYISADTLTIANYICFLRNCPHPPHKPANWWHQDQLSAFYCTWFGILTAPLPCFICLHSTFLCLIRL